MGLYDSLDDGESQSGATPLGRWRVIYPVEAIEDVRQSRSWNPWSLIRNLDAKLPGSYRRGKGYRLSGRAVFGGVVDEVKHGLLYPSPVDP